MKTLVLDTVLLEGIPQNAVAEDVDRFLSGRDFVPNSVRMFFKISRGEPFDCNWHGIALTGGCFQHKTMHNDGESPPRMLLEANKLVQLSLIIGSAQIRRHNEFWYAE
ncbi:hypothetical protein NC652_036566 [Populus alba x Populus x berolinensis]|nr:hypothetical protein NC652_036566 [Populus alba x Populus x berolinensis]